MPPPVPSNSAQGEACLLLSHCSWSNNLLLPKDLLQSLFHQENCHCPTNPTENMAQIPSAGNPRLIKEILSQQAEGRLLTATWDLALNPKRILSPSSFHGCNSVIPLCKSRINVLTLLRLFCSNSGLNAVWIMLTYMYFQSRAINLWEQQLTPIPTAKIPGDGSKAGSAVAMPYPATGTGRWALPYISKYLTSLE